MSTDTAFALGMLALVGPRFPDRLRGFMLTIIVVDDVIALLVIALAYSEDVALEPLLIAAGVFGLMLARRAAGVRRGLVYFLLAAVAWVALFESGVDPVVLGLAVGLITWAYPAGRGELERASSLFRSFREQPTPELAREAGAGLQAAVSPNARLLQLYHPWTSYVVVPLFALANVGIAIDRDFLSRGLLVADHARDHLRLRARQAGRRGRGLVAGDEAEPRPAAPAGRLGRRRRAAARSPGSASRSRC